MERNIQQFTEIIFIFSKFYVSKQNLYLGYKGNKTKFISFILNPNWVLYQLLGQSGKVRNRTIKIYKKDVFVLH